jgi:hypothetical protein
MDEKQAIEIVKTPTDGIAPITGEVSPSEEFCQDDKTVMDLYNSIEILKQQANKIDPYTGKIYETNSSYENVKLAGALHQVIEFVKEILPKKPRSRRARKARLRRERPPRPDMAGRAWQDKESELLVEQFDKGIKIAELVIIHQRTKGAIRSRLKKLKKIET